MNLITSAMEGLTTTCAARPWQASRNQDQVAAFEAVAEDIDGLTPCAMCNANSFF